MTRIPLASEKTLVDEFAGQALTGLLASPESRMPFDVVQRLAYDHAEAMIAEKERREAVVQQSSTTQDSGKVVELQEANRELVEALRLAVTHVEFFTSPPKGSIAEDGRNALLLKFSTILAKHKESK